MLSNFEVPGAISLTRLSPRLTTVSSKTHLCIPPRIAAPGAPSHQRKLSPPDASLAPCHLTPNKPSEKSNSAKYPCASNSVEEPSAALSSGLDRGLISPSPSHLDTTTRIAPNLIPELGSAERSDHHHKVDSSRSSHPRNAQSRTPLPSSPLRPRQPQWNPENELEITEGSRTSPTKSVSCPRCCQN